MPQSQMKRATFRIGVGLVGFLVLIATLMCAGVALADTGDTGQEDTAVEYVTYYRGSGCIKSGSCDIAGGTPAAVGTFLGLALALWCRRRS
jgi:hypothetical protein